MERMSMEEFDEYIKASSISHYLFHYSNQVKNQTSYYIKMSVTFNNIEVMPECDLIKFSSENGCMFADHVDSVSVHSGEPAGTVIEIFCDRKSAIGSMSRIVISAT